MSAYEIQVRDDLVQESTVYLEGTTYKIRLAYNSRQESWTISLLNSIGTPMIEGQKCVVDYNPFKNVLVADLPDGYFAIVDRTGTLETPDDTGLGVGKGAGLIYVGVQ